MPAFAKMSEDETESIVTHMLAEGLLNNNEGLLWFGKEGEAAFGRRNFMELLSVFQSPPLFTVRHGRTDLGEVHESSFLIRTGDRPVLSLAGRSWVATSIDWVKRVAYVEPTEQVGRSRWLGPGQPLSFRHCQAIKEVLISQGNSAHYSRRAAEEMRSAQEEFDFLSECSTTALRSQSEGRAYWWTFAGLRANAALSDVIRGLPGVGSFADNLAIRIEGVTTADKMESISNTIRENPPRGGSCAEVAKAIEDLKFSACLPSSLADQMLSIRLSDPGAVSKTLDQPLRVVTVP
jgi:ATP-dependent Lhr-like helicase